MSKTQLSLGPVQETLLIPLLGRAVETRRGKGLIHDLKAVSIVDQINYDFSQWKNVRSITDTTVRTRMIDEDVSAFLEEHPTGNIVEIGCGLNTRFERLDNGKAIWHEFDLPDVIELRKKFFLPTERRFTRDANVLSDDWFRGIRADQPTCFVAEAVLIYLNNSQAEQVLSTIASHFSNSWIITDTTPSVMVETQASHDAMKHLEKKSWFQWCCDHPKDLEKLGLRLQKSQGLYEAKPHIQKRLSLKMRVVYKFRFFWKEGIRNYRINLFFTDP
ncbi:MAG: class I SAM-dependent methyltransferase [Verrucomicrobiota bacterium]